MPRPLPRRDRAGEATSRLVAERPSHLAEGNVGEATHQYHIFRRILHAELGLEPSNAIKTLLRELVALAWVAMAYAPVAEAPPVV